MKKSLSLLLSLLLLLTLAVPALAEGSEDAQDFETSEGSAPDDTPSSSETAPDPEPDPDPDPDPAPDPDPLPDMDPDPSPPLPGTPPEDDAEAQQPAGTPPVDLDAPELPSGSGGMGAPSFDVTETPAGDIIIQEHSYTRTVDVSGSHLESGSNELTMCSALTAIFGEYTPKTQSVSTYYDGELLDTSTEYVPGVAGMDMEWIAGVIVFTVLLAGAGDAEIDVEDMAVFRAEEREQEEGEIGQGGEEQDCHL